MPDRIATGRRSAADEIAQAYMQAAVPCAVPGDRAGAVRAGLAGQRFAAPDPVFVLHPDRRLAGVVPLAELLAAAADMPMADLMRPDWPTVPPALHREETASAAIRAGVASVAVVDERARFLGAVSANALIGILRDEHMQDLHHMAGILGRSERARAALTAAPWRRAAFRLPWLVVGMLGAALSAVLMAGFEAELSAQIAVAFFVPAIVYLADAVGTQTEAVAVRDISLATGLRGILPLLAGEIATGVLIGVALGGLAFLPIRLGFGDPALALSVAVSITAAAAVATTVGFLLPLGFAASGVDPALASGPIATVIQDLLSLLIYFTVASVLLF